MERILFGDNHFLRLTIYQTKNPGPNPSNSRMTRLLLKHWMMPGMPVLILSCAPPMTVFLIFAILSGQTRRNIKISRYFPACPMPTNMLMLLQNWDCRYTETICTGNFFGSLFKGGVAYLSKDYLAIMELLIDSEVKMFKGIKNTRRVFTECNY
jgi:hypothetical protein